MRQITKIGFSIAFILFFISGPVLLFGQKPEKQIQKAEKQLAKEKYHEASEILRKVIEDDPENPHALFLQGKVMFLSGRRARAHALIEKSFAASQTADSERWYYLGRTRHYMEKYEDALTAYQEARIPLDPSDPQYEHILLLESQVKFAMDPGESPIPDVKINRLKEPINSHGSDHSPLIHPSGKAFFFTSNRSPDGKRTGLEEIYMIRINEDQEWQSPKLFTDVQTGKGHAALAGYSPNSSELLLFSNPPGEGDILMATYEDGGWGKPVPLGGYINSESLESSACISDDGNFCFFASERPGGFGGLDLYVAKKEGESGWGEPKNLGDQINTPQDEDGPFFHSATRTLYFSTDGLESIGGMDLFRTTLNTDGTWSSPEHLGTEINTPDDDVHLILSPDGKIGFYATNQPDGYGGKDIYVFSLDGNVPEIDVIKDPADTNKVLASEEMAEEMNEEVAMMEDSVVVVDSNAHETVSGIGSETAGTLPELPSNDPDIVLPDPSEELSELAQQEPETQPTATAGWQFNTYGEDDPGTTSEEGSSPEESPEVPESPNQEEPEIPSISESDGTPKPSPIDTFFVETEEFARRDMVVLKGKVIEALERSPIQSRISILDLEKQEIIAEFQNDETTGEYAAIIPGRRIYVLYVDRPEYKFHSQMLNAPNPGIEMEVSKDVVLEKLGIGSSDILSIYFENGQADLREESSWGLDQLFRMMASNPSLVIEIQGHTDNSGSERINTRLSYERARLVRDHLLKKGIEEERMEVKGYGGTEPRETNMTYEGRMKNNRIEYKVLKAPN